MKTTFAWEGGVVSGAWHRPDGPTTAARKRYISLYLGPL